MLAYAILNGVPFVYPDALVYFAYGETFWQKVGSVLPDIWQADAPAGTVLPPAPLPPETLAVSPPATGQDGDIWTPEAGRSIYYSVLSAMPGVFTAPWNGVVLQAYCSALVVAFAWRAILGTVGLGYVAVMAVFGLFSTFGVFASTAMPDIWAAIAVLSVAVIVWGRDGLSRLDLLVLWGFVLFAAVAHSSHLALIAVLMVLCASARIAGLSMVGWGVVGKLLVTLVVAVGLGAAGKIVMERAAGNPPLGMPFLTAHLVDGGPGMALIREACPAAGFAVCDRADQLPLEWRDFLFGFAGAEDYRLRLVEDDVAFAIATLRHDPVAVLGLALRDAARQIVMIDLVTTPIRADIGERVAIEEVRIPLGESVRGGILYKAGWFYRDLAILNKALVLVGTAALAYLALRGNLDRNLRGFLVLCIAGVLLNAAICGVLASPYDRFQARIAWLIPLLSIIALVAHARGRQPHPQRKSRTSWPLSRP